MRAGFLAGFGLGVVLAAWPSGSAVAEEPPAAEQVARPSQAVVDKAVRRGVKWLKKEQKRDGSFGTMAGETALVLLALRLRARAGRSRVRPVVTRRA